jgi:hypothetical protein
MNPDLDAQLLSELRDLYTDADPMPTDLVTRVRFALALENLDVEVARMTTELQSAVRADPGDEESRTITFDSPNLTVMVVFDRAPDGTVRMDGWLAPPAPYTVEMRTVTGSLRVVADDDGRFVVEGVPSGMTQLVVRPRGGDDRLRRPVVTPAFMV